MKKKTSFNLAYLFIALFAIVMVRDAWVSMEEAAGLLLERETLAQADLAGFAARMAKMEGVLEKAA